MLPHQLLFFRPHFLIFGQLSIIVGLLWVACARQKAPTEPSKAETMHCWETVKQSTGQWPHKCNILVHSGLLHRSWNQTGADGVGGAGAGAPIRCCHHLFATYTTPCTNFLQLWQTWTYFCTFRDLFCNSTIPFICVQKGKNFFTFSFASNFPFRRYIPALYHFPATS